MARYAVRNVIEAPCRHCGKVHPFYTRNDKVLLVDSTFHDGEYVEEMDADVQREIEACGVADIDDLPREPTLVTFTFPDDEPD